MRSSAVLALASSFVIALALEEDEFVAKINAKTNGVWTAGPSRLGGRDIKTLLGSLEDPNPRDYRTNENVPEGFQAPDTFDSRKNWPDCKSISLVWDQAACGSCWAVAAAGAMSDRLCIHLNRKDLVSPYNLLTCCWACGNGCYGGYPIAAWTYWNLNGISTGGLFNTTDSCQPYDIPPCDHHVEGHYEPCGDTIPTPSCQESCVNGNDYEEDKTFGHFPYYVSILSNEEGIQREIMTNGPIEASFDVYEDFLYYESGVYHHVEGEYKGGHAVRMIGWGEENNTPYWLLVNSWNEDWGEKGLFKIKRGNNECGIEGGLVAGLPK